MSIAVQIENRREDILRLPLNIARGMSSFSAR